MEMILKFSSRDLEQRGHRESLYKEQQIVSINGVEQTFMLVCTERIPFGLDCFLGEQHYYGFEYTVTLQSVEKAKSKQELDAEDAVKKAKTSLEAAQAVLQSVKGV